MNLSKSSSGPGGCFSLSEPCLWALSYHLSPELLGPRWGAAPPTELSGAMGHQQIEWQRSQHSHIRLKSEHLLKSLGNLQVTLTCLALVCHSVLCIWALENPMLDMGSSQDMRHLSKWIQVSTMLVMVLSLVTCLLLKLFAPSRFPGLTSASVA